MVVKIKSPFPLLIFWSFFNLYNAGGQELSTIRGNIVDQTDRKLVPYATVHIKNQNIATLTNSEGFFEFHFPSKHLNDSVVFSCLGYTPLIIQAKELLVKREFLLEPSVVVLTEIIVGASDEDAVKEIIRKSIQNISKNYPDTFLLHGFFRKYQKIDQKYISYLDAAVELYDDQFTKDLSKKKQPEMINVKATRKSFTFNLKGYKNWVDHISDSSHWLARLLSRNDVRYRNGLLNKNNKFELAGYTTFNNRLCYKISVPRKPTHYIRPDNNNYEATITLVIDADNFKIYHIIDEEKSKSTGKNRNFSWEKKINEKISARIVGGKRVVEFKEFNGKLYPHYMSEIVYVEDYEVKTKNTVHLNEYFWELFINEIEDHARVDLKKFSYGYRDDLKMSLLPYDPSFWSTYNFIPFNSENKKAFKDLSEELPVEQQFKQSNYELNIQK